MASGSAGSQTGYWVAGGCLVVAGLIAAFVMRPDPTSVGSTPSAAPAVESISVAPPVDAPASEQEQVEQDDAAPRFDVVRVEPSGAAVIAGQGVPGETVDILLDGDVIGQAVVDTGGRFATLQQLDPSSEAQALGLASGQGDARLRALEEVLLAPRSEGEAEEPQPVLRADATGVEVIAPVLPADAAPELVDTVALDTITYAPSGEVALGGRASTRFVRIYLDDAPVLTAPVQEDGQWRTALPEVDTGVYQLRVDELDDAGRVASRVETPFRREDRAAVAAQIGAVPEGNIAVRTVQPGATLWAIARERYGDGALYVRVFEANRDRIRDPDLIYPGQVFSIPD
mgnify:FL=1